MDVIVPELKRLPCKLLTIEGNINIEGKTFLIVVMFELGHLANYSAILKSSRFHVQAAIGSSVLRSC